MELIRSALFFLRLPFVRLYVKLRYGDYWALREHLQEKDARRGKPSRILWRACDRYFWKQGSFIGRGARFAGRPYFPHGCLGVFISNDAVIGRDAVIFQQVTIGSNTLPDSKRPGSPTVGDGAYIGAGAKIIGGVTVGDHCRVGANAVVYQDMPPHSVALCAPTRIVQKEKLDNTFRVKINGVDCVSRDGRLVKEEK